MTTTRCEPDDCGPPVHWLTSQADRECDICGDHITTTEPGRDDAPFAYITPRGLAALGLTDHNGDGAIACLHCGVTAQEKTDRERMA